MRFAPQLSRKARTPPANAPAAPAVAPRVLTRNTYGAKFRLGDSFDPDRVVTEALERNVWSYRAIMSIAVNAAKLPIVWRQGDPYDGSEVADHPMLDLLNARPNRYERAVIFRRRLSVSVLTSLTGAFVEVQRSRIGTPLSLHLLPPTSIRIVPDTSERLISEFVVEKNGLVMGRVAPDDMIWIREPHPYDVFAAIPPIKPASVAIDLDWMAKMFQRSFLQNDGRLGGIVGIKGDLAPEDADMLDARLAGGYARAGEWITVEADGIDVREMGNSPRDAQYIEQRSASQAETLMAWGTPKSVAGDASERTFSNSDSEGEGFWNQTMLPHLSLIGAGLDALDDDPKIFAAFDTAGVPELQRHQLDREERDAKRFNDGLITIDEWREKYGYEPFGEPSTQTLYLPTTKIPVGEDAQFIAPPVASAPRIVPAPSAEGAA